MKKFVVSLFAVAFLTAACEEEKKTLPAKEDIPVTGITLSKTELYLVVDDAERLVETVLPENATEKGVNWQSSNTAVATVSQKGEILALLAGETTITARTLDGGRQAQCKVTVVDAPIPVRSVEFKEKTMLLFIDKTAILEITVTPSDATNTKVTWETDAEEIVTVNEGLVTAIAVGEATIRVTTEDGGHSDEMVITVTDAMPANSVTLGKKTLELKKGEYETLEVTVLPEEATDKNMLEWTSSNESIATVADGRVTAVSAGSATITVTTANGEGSDQCVVTVVPAYNVSEITFPASLTGTQFTNNWWGEGNYDVSWLAAHNASAAAPAEYVITTAAELAGLSFYVNAWGPNATTDKEALRWTTVKLGADIDLSAHYWVPIGSARNSFKGSFDGQGHTVTGLYIDFSDPYTGTLGNSTSGTATPMLHDYGVANVTNFAGLFGRINEGNVTVRNLIMGKGLVMSHPSSFYTSAVCAYANSAVNFINVINSGTVVKGGNAVGALVGGTSNIPSITACANTALIIASYAPAEGADASIADLNFALGGLAGFVQNAAGPLIKNSYNAGVMVNESASTKLFTGGLVGVSGAALNAATVPAAINAASAAAFYAVSSSWKDTGGADDDKITGSAVTAEEMKTAAFLNRLNEGLEGVQWITVPSENNGFPVFAK